ncbi:malonyl-CoA decarboxylase [Marinomonas rhizomae]|uniref:malonyl-CoA decarboxylase n=1 Tax=Marinomonas rhizomae TaxID=491948 RepID=UPI0021073D2C|nr:malonyl-CoA decarboxylase [Marinomonas rhizomae]UTV98986.1 malonyl-CoA decarboxylase [Marinomonas rhizomae]
MNFFTELFSSVFDRRYRKARSNEEDNRTVKAMCQDLLTRHGEVSGGALARNILDRYDHMSSDEKRELFEFMTHDLEVVSDDVIAALAEYQKQPSKQTYKAFASASEPRRQELIRRFNQVPGATPKLVKMREDLLKATKEDASLGILDVDFNHLFTSWFNRGFLVLRPINWDSPASILEKIIAYEAVHAIDSWDDLRQRLKPSDRRCYGFFHPTMADEPLIFVEVALTKGTANSIQSLLTTDRDVIEADEADTAVFYSISNCQPGLAGISFGNFLIKQVAANLAKDLENLETFVTLSPIPGLAKWVNSSGVGTLGQGKDQALAAHYLLNAKHSDGKPLDPVTRFHLGNGAMIQAVHADADISPNGLKQSNGAMVNYLYDLDKVSKNHEKFVTEQKVVASDAVHAMSASIATRKKGE